MAPETFIDCLVYDIYFLRIFLFLEDFLLRIGVRLIPVVIYLSLMHFHFMCFHQILFQYHVLNFYTKQVWVVGCIKDVLGHSAVSIRVLFVQRKGVEEFIGGEGNGF